MESGFSFFVFLGGPEKVRKSARKWSRFGAGNEAPETLILNSPTMILVVFRPPGVPENGAKMAPKRGPEFGLKRGLGKTPKGGEKVAPEPPRLPPKKKGGKWEKKCSQNAAQPNLGKVYF